MSSCQMAGYLEWGPQYLQVENMSWPRRGVLSWERPGKEPGSSTRMGRASLQQVQQTGRGRSLVVRQLLCAKSLPLPFTCAGNISAVTDGNLLQHLEMCLGFSSSLPLPQAQTMAVSTQGSACRDIQMGVRRSRPTKAKEKPRLTSLLGAAAPPPPGSGQQWGRGGERSSCQSGPSRTGENPGEKRRKGLFAFKSSSLTCLIAWASQ